MSLSVRAREDCRLCASRRLERVLSLGSTPLANAFVAEADRTAPQPRFPLDLWLCRACGHLQLRDVVDPELLFRNYVYVSGTSPVFVEHFRRYAEAMLAFTRMPPGSAVVEIGSNDGTLLRCFQQAGMRVLGIDPARAIAQQAAAQGLPTRPEFFTPELARALKQEGWEAALIAANNVFAHADDLGGIADGVAHLLAPSGVFVFEVSYLVDVLDHLLFDTIYHEHLSYHTVTPLQAFFRRHGLELVDAVRVEPHGGSLRGIAQRAGGPWPVSPRVQERVALERERGTADPAAYQAFQARIAGLKAQLLELLRRRKKRGRRIVGFGAPAKATTLMFHFDIGPELMDYVVDDSPWKQGLYSPGHHLPVKPTSALYDPALRPDDALILAWNFAPSILAKHRKFLEAGGEFIVPLPKLEVVTA